MTEDKIPKPAREPAAAASAARQRKKRKWDQPAEALISAGVALSGPLQLGMYGTPGISIPGVVPFSCGVLTNQVPATFNATSQITSVISHTADAAVQRLNQQKMQDELIAREIVINDAEPTIRYKLTKRQTQEEIQKSTGAVVITRGKYRPPNGLPDNEKPLYLHISAGSHLKDIAERIKAVDRAALMIEEILKQGHTLVTASTPFHPVTINGQMAPLLSTCVFLGFETDPSINIAARIRGPNDQYINHIMNETGGTVILRGRGSGSFESSLTEETQQPLHLYLSSINSKSLESAKILAENLMDTICAECGATRNTSSNIYGAVPPPQQLSTEVHSPPKVKDANGNLNAVLPTTSTGSMPPAPVLASTGAAYSGALIQPSVLPGYVAPQTNLVSYPYPSVTSGTCYDGYGGIYPQATPLQQVALALRQAPPSTFYVPSVAPLTNTSINMSSTSTSEMDKKPSQKRKFQELPVSLNGATVDQNLRQEEFLKSGPDDLGARNVSYMPPPKKLISPGSNGILPPPPRNMPPPPPKFSESHSLPKSESVNPIVKNSPPKNMPPPPPPPKFAAPRSPPQAKSSDPIMVKSNSEALPDPLLKLMEYGEEDDEIDVPGKDSTKNSTTWNTTPKPFWAA